MAKRKLTTIGWREWVFLPTFGSHKINAKIDTGASTSALHAEDITLGVRGGVKIVRFKFFPHQGTHRDAEWVEAEYVEKRRVRSSVGHETLRPVIRTEIQLGDERFEVEITLVDRGAMGFRMLIGRTALKKRFLVNAGASYVVTKSLNRRKRK